MDNDERRWERILLDGTEQILPRWVVCEYGEFVFFSTEDIFMEQYRTIRDGGDDHTRVAFVGPRYNDLFRFLQGEEEQGPNSIFNDFRFMPEFEYVDHMIGQACQEIIRAHALQRVTDNARFCYVLNAEFMNIFERGFRAARRLLGPPEWWTDFHDKVIGQSRLLNSMSITDAARLSHAWMLIVVQDKIEEAEAEHGRLEEKSVAETYVGRLAKVAPSLYAMHVHGLFANGVYGRPAKVPSIVTPDE